MKSGQPDPDDDVDAWEEILRDQYGVTAWAYFNRSFNMLPRATADRTIFFYCAFELRCAIERVFYEYLSHFRSDQLTGKEAKLWSPKGLKTAVLAIDPDFIAKVDFLNLILEARGLTNRFTIPDLDRLSRDYGRLSEYLHAQRVSRSLNAPSWWASFRELIENLHDYAWPLCSETRVSIQLNEVAERYFDDLQANRRSREATIEALKVYPEGFEVAAQYRNFFD